MRVFSVAGSSTETIGGIIIIGVVISGILLLALIAIKSLQEDPRQP